MRGFVAEGLLRDVIRQYRRERDRYARQTGKRTIAEEKRQEAED